MWKTSHTESRPTGEELSWANPLKLARLYATPDWSRLLQIPDTVDEWLQASSAHDFDSYRYIGRIVQQRFTEAISFLRSAEKFA